MLDLSLRAALLRAPLEIMKRMRGKEIILLVLPSAALLGFAVLLPRLQAKPRQTIVLSSLTVKPVPKTQINTADVEVDAQFHYNQSPYERYILRSASATLANAHIVDSTGKKHYMMTWSEGAKQSISPSSWGVGSTAGLAKYPLWLRYFPKSAGKLTFKVTVIAHDGYKLPVSVVVRN